MPFVHHHIVECTSDGQEYTSVEHDITLKIPKGAINKNQLIHFEIRVALYGPFNFPENTQPISPILWLCILEDVELRKPFQIILPHFLTGISQERLQYHQVGFAKAKHNDCTLVNNKRVYNFLDVTESRFASSTSGIRNYGILESQHCCFYCLKAKKTPELTWDSGYCLARIESALLAPQTNEVYFLVFYFLETCLQVCLCLDHNNFIII